MGFTQAIKTVLSKYAVFNGRARRSEYWFFYLFIILISFVIGFVLGLMGLSETILYYVIEGLLYLVLFVPSIAVGVRRLHDIGKSGTWLFISFVPLIGGLILLLMLVIDSEPGVNKYGPNPKETGSNEEPVKNKSIEPIPIAVSDDTSFETGEQTISLAEISSPINIEHSIPKEDIEALDSLLVNGIITQDEYNLKLKQLDATSTIPCSGLGDAVGIIDCSEGSTTKQNGQSTKPATPNSTVKIILIAILLMVVVGSLPTILSNNDISNLFSSSNWESQKYTNIDEWYITPSDYYCEGTYSNNGYNDEYLYADILGNQKQWWIFQKQWWNNLWE